MFLQVRHVFDEEAYHFLHPPKNVISILLEEMIVPGLVFIDVFFDVAPSQVSTASLDWAKTQSCRTLQSV